MNMIRHDARAYCYATINITLLINTINTVVPYANNIFDGSVSFSKNDADVSRPPQQPLTPSSEVSKSTASGKRPSLIAVYTIDVYWPSGTIPFVDMICNVVCSVLVFAWEWWIYFPPHPRNRAATTSCLKTLVQKYKNICFFVFSHPLSMGMTINRFMHDEP